MSIDVSQRAGALGEGAPRRRRWVVRAVIVTVALLLIAAAWVGVRAVLAASELAGLEQEFLPHGAEDEPAELSSETLAGIVAQLPELAERTARARALVGDPVWRLAEQAPLAGDPLRTLRVVTEQADALVAGTAVPLLNAISAEQNDFLTGEKIDMAAVRRVASAIDEAGDQVASSRGTLDRLAETAGKSALGRVERLRSLVRTADETLHSLRVLAAAAPELLGDQDPRDYLVLFLTPAELRSGGGLPGAAATVGFDNGTASGGHVYSTRDYSPAASTPVVPLTATELALYGDRPARLLQDTTATDDFTRTGELARALTELHLGVSPTGVLAIDVIAVGYLLEATGPVELDDGETITAQNAAELLMNTVYIRYPEPAQQDAYFAMITQRALEAATTRGPDPALLMSAAIRGVREGRIQAWSADVAVQTALGELGVAERADSLEGPVVGVHLNDRTGAKMDFYLGADAEVVWTTCPDGRRLDQVRVTLENSIAAEDVAALPWYITGDGSVVEKGRIATQIVITGAVGSTIVAEPEADIAVRDDADRPRVAWTVDIGPGEKTTRTVVIASSGAAGAPDIDATPAVAVDTRESQGSLAGTCNSGD